MERGGGGESGMACTYVLLTLLTRTYRMYNGSDGAGAVVAQERKRETDSAPRERLSWSGATSHNLEKTAGTGSRDERQS